jgi:hypothetical protein
MESVKKQGICVEFCFKAETHNMLHEAYGDDASSQTTTYEWFKRFKNGITSTDDDDDDDDDDEQSSQTSTSRSKSLTTQVKNIIHENHQLTVREVAEKAGISIGSRLLIDDLQNLLTQLCRLNNSWQNFQFLPLHSSLFT